MITTSDINKLKTVFVTKEYFKKELKKELNNYPTKDDLKNELSKYATQESQQDIVNGINTIIEMLGGENTKNKKQDDILEHHEHRLDKLENKVFSTN